MFKITILINCILIIMRITLPIEKNIKSSASSIIRINVSSWKKKVLWLFLNKLISYKKKVGTLKNYKRVPLERLSYENAARKKINKLLLRKSCGKNHWI